jgi:hypothetical protein
MIARRFVVRLEKKSGNSCLHIGSARIKAAEPHLPGTSHCRKFPLAMITLLTAALGFNPAAHAQMFEQIQVSRGRFNRSGITQ